MMKIAVAAAVGALGWAYVALIKPPPPNVCGSPGGPPVTSPRIKLSDGRHLAYRERGVSKEKATYKIIIVHGLDNSKDLELPISQELIEELQIYLLSYDRAGYGESDPYPRRTIKSEAFDIQELADKLQLGPKFYVLGMSMGACAVYSCLKYIPHRLAGVSLVVPFVHYWWPRFPAKILQEGLQRHLLQDQRTFRVAHYAPWLLHWWMNQKWVPSLSMLQGNMAVFCPKDLETIQQLMEAPNDNQERLRQQGLHESLYRDMIMGFGDWQFSPLDLPNPFPNNEGSVHIWQGQEDRIIPSVINRHISEQLTWIQYHEVPNAGHLMIFDSRLCESIFRTLVAP
ncbi:hypothetical protein DM860_018073 [Cuscuta australis]|uniref:AB hydrolase-1 domain-containing protein n=1 Tax=Cuscuta australis TaxID=267555 RepID=A0A328D2X3_9ASTE|nr:hypothetical protein DM860_018073 [Cuscuta australis]